MATTQFQTDKNINGVNGWGLLFCKQVYNSTLGAATEATVTVPATAAMGVASGTQQNKFIAVITTEQSKKVYAALNGTAAVPVGNTFAASTSALLPIQSARYVKAGDVIHFISAAAADVSVEFYAIQDS